MLKLSFLHAVENVCDPQSCTLETEKATNWRCHRQRASKYVKKLRLHGCLHKYVKKKTALLQ